jgi:hypothetical protein
MHASHRGWPPLFYADSSEIDIRDQFIDRASQSSAQRRLELERE